MNKFFQSIGKAVLWIRDTLLFGQWINFWNWIKLAHSSSDDASSKRLYGGIIVLNCLVIFDLFSAGIFKHDAWKELASYWNFSLILGASMISVEVIIKLASVISSLRSGKTSQDN